MTVALIADIVGSRSLRNRAAVQRDLERVLAEVDAAHPVATTALAPVVGDELQGVYPDLQAAAATTLLLRLALPEGIDVRFGLGLGAIEEIPSAVGTLSEGPAWWAARGAVETVEELARRAVPSARTWSACPADAPASTRDLVRLANAGLLARDGLIAGMSARTRRLTFGRCLDRTQRDLAAEEGITQSAVSQALASGEAAALVEAFRALRG